jgi:hypothetical protein
LEKEFWGNVVKYIELNKKWWGTGSAHNRLVYAIYVSREIR